MHTVLIPVQKARKENFAAMANALFYSRFINTGALKTTLIGARRYTTDQWIAECLSELASKAEKQPVKFVDVSEMVSQREAAKAASRV